MRKRFLVDADEVLADFKTPLFQIASDLFGLTLRAEDCDVWDLFTLFTEEQRVEVCKVIDQPGWCSSMEPKPGAQAAITRIRDFMDVYCVTSHWPSPTWVHERDNWLIKLFGFSRKQIVHTSAKFLCKGDAFLDDHPDHVTSWLKEHPEGSGMLWHIPNTSKYPNVGHLRVHTWDE